MTNAENIRLMNDEELVDLLVWGMVNITEVPSCEEGCDDFSFGCAYRCTNEKRERAVREWLQREC